MDEEFLALFALFFFFSRFPRCRTWGGFSFIAKFTVYRIWHVTMVYSDAFQYI